MIALENILSQEIIQKLGWTLVHFIWQAAVVALLLAILLRILRKSTANLRYVFACLALGLIVLLPVITIQLVPVSAIRSTAFQAVNTGRMPVPPPAVEMSAPETIVIEKPAQPQIVTPAFSVPWKQRAIETLEPALPYIVSGWLVGVFGLSIWHLGGWTQLQRLKRRMVKQVDNTLHSKLKVLAQRLRVRQTVQLMESALVQIPTVVGWLRPVILLPASALTGLSPEQLEAILAHELAHIHRCDYLINILQTVVEILGFYHPAVWWVSHKIRAERENCCDDLAVSVSGDRVRYARALTSMEEIRTGQGQLAVAAGGGNLFKRIYRLLGKDSEEKTSFNWIPAATAILLILALVIPTALALTAKSNPQQSAPKIDSDKPSLTICTGRIINSKGNPLASAKVAAYEEYFDMAGNVKLRLIGESVTKADGNFIFQTRPSVEKNRSKGGLIVAQKEGLAIGWAHWPLFYGNQRATITLQEPTKLSGMVVDENGKSIPDAEVRAVLFENKTTQEGKASWLPGIRPFNGLLVRTNKNGRFEFNNIPENIASDLLVTASGFSTIYTRKPDIMGYKGAEFTAGQTDIKITMPAEARIKGKVVNKKTGAGLPGITLRVVPHFTSVYFERYLCTTKEDGTFNIGGLRSGKYMIRRVVARTPTTDVVAESGKTTRNVILKIPYELRNPGPTGSGIIPTDNDQSTDSQVWDDILLGTPKEKESSADSIPVPVPAKSPAPSAQDKTIIQVDCLIVEVSLDSKMDRETTIIAENLLGNKISLRDIKVDVLLRKAAKATAAIKDKSAENERVTQDQFQALVDMLTSKGYLRILMNPRIQVVDGKTAKITSTQKISSTQGSIEDSIQITPHVFADGHIILQVEAAISSKSIPKGVEQIPTITTREVSTLVTTSPGESLMIIGGLKETEKSTKPNSNVKDSEKQTTELLFILTPTIVTSTTDSQEKTDVRIKSEETASAENSWPSKFTGDKTRIVHFPKSRTLGTLYLRDSDIEGRKSWEGWKELGQARGEISVPEGKELQLVVREKTFENLADLAALRANDIQNLHIISAGLQDADMVHLRGLTGLQSLTLSSGSSRRTCPMTGEGLVNLKGMNSLLELMIQFTRLRDESLAHLKYLTNLENLWLWNDEELTGEGLSHLRDLPSLRSISFYTVPIEDSGLEKLKGMIKLERLSLQYTKVTDDGLAHLKGLTGLKYLVLPPDTTDAGLANLKGLSSLEELVISSDKVTTEGLAHLKSMSRLKSLSLGVKINGQGWAHLHDMPQLREIELHLGTTDDAAMKGLKGLTSVTLLDLGRTQVSDAGLANIEGLTALEYLSLKQTQITDTGLAYLKGLTSLRTLDLEGTEITDAGLANLQGLSSLRTLWLQRTDITDAGLVYLKGLKSLETLYLSDTQVSDAGLVNLKGLRSLQHLTLNNTNVSGDGLAHLKSLKSLRELYMRVRSISEMGLRHLKEMTWLHELGLGSISEAELRELENALPDCIVNVRRVSSSVRPPIPEPVPAENEQESDSQVEVKRVLSADRLKCLGLAVAMYADDHDENLPQNLQQLKLYIQNEQDFDWLLDNAEYFGSGKSTQRNAAFIPIAYDKSLFLETDATNVLFLDFSVRFLQTEQLEKLNIKRAELLIDARFLAVGEDFIQSIGRDADSPDKAKALLRLKSELFEASDGSKTQSLILDDLKTSLLLEAARTHKDSGVLAAPQILTREGKTAEIRVHNNETYYISGYSEPNRPSEKPQPKIDKVEEGISLSVKPRLTPNKNIDIEFELEITQASGFEEHKYDGKYPYKLPSVQKITQATHYIARNGQTLLFGGHKIADKQYSQTEQKDLLILIKAKTVGSPVQAKDLILAEPGKTTSDVIIKPGVVKSRTVTSNEIEQEKTKAASEQQPQMVQKSFKLKYRSPSQMAQILRPLLTKTGHVSADESTGILLLIDTPENLKRIEKIIAAFDVLQAEQTVQKFFKLKYHNSSQMAQILKPLLTKTGYISTYESTNSLLVIDTVENLKRIELIIAEFDVAKVEQTVTEIFEIRYGDPAEIVKSLRMLITGQPGFGAIIEPPKQPVVLIPEPMRNWIIAKASAEDMKQIGEWIEKLDREEPAKKDYELVMIRYTDVTELADRLNESIRQIPGLQSQADILIQPLEKAKQIVIFGRADMREMVKKLIAEIDIPSGEFETRVFKLKYSDPNQIKENIDNLYGGTAPGGPARYYYYRYWQDSQPGEADIVKVISYPELKQVTVIASAENMLKIAEQIKEWDVPLDVEKLKPRIIELQNSDAAHMADLLRTLFAEEGGRSLNIYNLLFGSRAAEKQKIVEPLYGQLTFEEVPGTNKLIVISKIPEAYDVVEEFICDLDRQKMTPEDMKQIGERIKKLDREEPPLITKTFIDVELPKALQDIGSMAGIPIIPDEKVVGLVTAELKDVPLEKALDIVLAGTPYVVKKTPYYYLVTSAAEPLEIQKRVDSAKKLSNLGKALLIYANDHEDKYPDYLHTFTEYLKLEDFNWAMTNVEYLGRGKTIAVRPDTMIAYDKTLLAERKGTNVLFNDSHVEFVKPERLKELGISATEIQIETQILFVSEDFLQSIGLDANSVHSSDAWSEHLVADSAAEPNAETYSLILDDLHIRFLLKAVQAHKGATVLISPRVMTREGTTASMAISTEEYYVLGYTEPNDPSDKPVPKVDEVKLGTRIWLEPELTPDNEKIKLDFKMEFSQLLGYEEHKYKGKYIYLVPRTEVVSTEMPCLIPDGKTLLIGGQKITDQASAAPILSRLPVIGELFRSRDKTKDQRILLILVKPIINPQQKASKILSGQANSEEHIKSLANQLEKKLNPIK